MAAEKPPAPPKPSVPDPRPPTPGSPVSGPAEWPGGGYLRGLLDAVRAVNPGASHG